MRAPFDPVLVHKSHIFIINYMRAKQALRQRIMNFFSASATRIWRIFSCDIFLPTPFQESSTLLLMFLGLRTPNDSTCTFVFWYESVWVIKCYSRGVRIIGNEYLNLRKTVGGFYEILEYCRLHYFLYYLIPLSETSTALSQAWRGRDLGIKVFFEVLKRRMPSGE